MANEIYHRSNWGNAVNDIAWGDVYEKFDATNEMFVRSDNYENSNETDKLMAAINPKPSILLTPTAYDNGSLHSVKPVRTFGSELVTNGGFDVDSDWIKGTGWTISGGTANQDGSNGILRQNSVISTNTKVKVTFDLTNYGGSGSLFVKFAPNQYPITLNGNGSYTVFTDGTNSTNGDLQIITDNGFVGSIDNVSVKEVIDADFDFSRGTIATRVNEQGLIEDVTDTNLPRIDYTDGTGSLLLEPQSTNLITYSEDFNSAAWLLSDLTATANQINSPDGTLNASKLEMTDNGSLRNQSQMTFSDAYSYSIFVKKGNSRYVTLRSAFFTQSIVVGFDLDSETAQTDGKIENYGNDWYRLSISKDISSDADKSGFFYMYLPNSLGGQTSVSGNFAYYYGAQIEDSTFPTSYIPTSGSTVTRSADVANNSGSSDLINSTEGVLYLEVAALTSINNFQSISLSDGTNQNNIRFILGNVLNRASFQVKVGNTSQVFKNIDTTDITDFNKIAFKYKENDFAAWLNGVEVATDTSGTVPTVNQLLFTNGGAFNNFEGKVKSVAVYKEALTDAELTALTT